MSDLHPFERAGLGKAPFICTGVSTNWYSAGPDHRQPGGNCNYCGTGILYEYAILSADGRKFVVGSDCVKRSGAHVTGFREQRLNLAREKRATRRAEDRAAREARWAAQRAERAKTFRNDSNNHDLIQWLEETPEGSRDEFRLQMRDSLRNWGSLTERQRDAAHASMLRQAERARQEAASDHIGEVGKKLEGEFKIQRVASWESFYGWPRKMVYLTVMALGDNIVVYKGNPIGVRGQAIRGTFTIKEHGEREGVRQTIVNRPRNIEVLS